MIRATRNTGCVGAPLAGEQDAAQQRRLLQQPKHALARSAVVRTGAARTVAADDERAGVARAL